MTRNVANPAQIAVLAADLGRGLVERTTALEPATLTLATFCCS